MKTNKLLSIVLLTALLTGACKQTPIDPQPPVITEDPTPSKGSADFTKFIALGDSYTAGMQAGSLFNDGQAVSMGKMLADQFTTVGGGAFNQPDIGSVNGFNSSASNPGGGIIRGRFLLFDPDGDVDPDGTGCQTSRSAGPKAAGTPLTTTTCPSTVTTPAMPAPYNTADLPGAFAGDKAALNNFGVPGTRVFHTTAAAFGNPTPGVGNPYYARFATAPGTSLLLTDAASKGGSFFLLYLGNFDILNYATAGALGSLNGTGSIDLTPQATFDFTFDLNLNGLLAVPNSKGVVGTIPDITTLPFFTTVTWNAIEFKSTNCTDAATLASLNGPAGFGGYNAALDALVGLTLITAGDAAVRKVIYAYGKNGILIKDETLTDIASLFALLPGGAALAPYGRVRQAKSTDLITLSAGGILGTCPNPPNSPTFVSGVSAPLDDQYVLIPTEIADIQARTIAFNDKIKAAAAAATDRVAVADVYKAYKDLATDALAGKFYSANGVTVTPSFAPPGGMFSEDAVHPNSRGYAFTANVFIEAINAKFGAVIPKVNLSSYPGTGFPLKGQ